MHGKNIIYNQWDKINAWNMTGQTDVDYATGEVWETSMDILTFTPKKLGQLCIQCESKLTTAMTTFQTHLLSKCVLYSKRRVLMEYSFAVAFKASYRYVLIKAKGSSFGNIGYTMFGLLAFIFIFLCKWIWAF